eukprot:gene17781-18000_t
MINAGAKFIKSSFSLRVMRQMPAIVIQKSRTFSRFFQYLAHSANNRRGAMAHSASPEAANLQGVEIDANAKFVRVTEVRPDGFVAFDFAIGEPEIYVEMLLTQEAFAAFCQTNAVIRLDHAPDAPHADFLWRLSDATRAAEEQLMQLDLRTVTIKPLRQTFTHVARRIGGDKPASRYQEGTYDIQATINFHYRPLWAPEYEIFDASRSAIVMADWYKLIDPRQFYYGAYTLARARMQDAAEADFALVEDRALAASLPQPVRDLALALYVPLRHLEWGANTNSMFMAAYGYGTAFTAPCLFHAMDHLGMAQYLTRVGLTLGDEDTLHTAKQAWLQAPEWQGLRRYVEDCFVVQDPVELFVAHSLVLDGLLFPLFYGEIDTRLAGLGGGAILSMLTRFEAEWFTETTRWTNAVIKIMAAESAANAAQLQSWIAQYLPAARAALNGLAELAFGPETDAVLDQLVDQFAARLAKLGLITMADNVFIAFQTNDESRAIIEAIMADNPAASLDEQPAMVRVVCPGRLTIKRESVEERMGRDFDLQELQLHLITLTGNIDETNDEFTLAWRN